MRGWEWKGICNPSSLSVEISVFRLTGGIVVDSDHTRPPMCPLSPALNRLHLNRPDTDSSMVARNTLADPVMLRSAWDRSHRAWTEVFQVSCLQYKPVLVITFGAIYISFA